MRLPYTAKWGVVAVLFFTATGILLFATPAVVAQATRPGTMNGAPPTTNGPPAAMIDRLRNNARAAKWYTLHCSGCHRPDGGGSPQNGVPSFVDSAGLFTWLPAGREYLIRVPGSASSHLSNAQLATVLNWIVTTFSAAQLPPFFEPYTESEVAAVRNDHYQDVAAVRRRIAHRMVSMGLEPSLYLFGVNRWNKEKVSAGDTASE